MQPESVHLLSPRAKVHTSRVERAVTSGRLSISSSSRCGSPRTSAASPWSVRLGMRLTQSAARAVECAATAVVLNVYEIMSEKPTQRMSHIAGARALIRECGWNARSTGLGAACFVSTFATPPPYFPFFLKYI